MKKLFTALLVLLIVAVVGVKAYSDNNRQTDWQNTRVVKTITVHNGDTLDGISYEYKPSWMDVREYRHMVMELNDMDSATIYQGQSLDVYVCAKHYTAQGLHLDNGTIITTDGNEWGYDTDIQGCIEITFSDNGTPNDIYDDIIISIKEV